MKAKIIQIRDDDALKTGPMDLPGGSNLRVHGWLLMDNFFDIWKFVLPLLLVTLLTISVLAEAPAPKESIWNSSRLTGEWGGLRSSLADKGLSFDLEYTSTYQGLLAGTGSDDYKYGGKFDAFLNLDSSKMGLWEGGGVRTHFEYNHGDAEAFRGGVFFPVNSAQFTPLGVPEEVEATSVYFTQNVGDQSAIMLGKICALDLLRADPFFGGWGTQRFMNLAFVAPPSGVVPPVFMGAVASIKTQLVSWNIMVFDPNDRTTDYLPDDLFSDGVNISVSGNHLATLSGRKTKYTLNTTYSTQEGADLSSLPSNLETKTKKGSYNISFQFLHNLQESADNPDAGWGFNIKAAIADGNPNAIKASVVGGIGGRALFFERPQDSFGLGYYFYDYSDHLRDSQDPSADFNNEQGLEVFYNYEVTPWLHITGDVQYINPAASSYDNAVIAALRGNIRF